MLRTKILTCIMAALLIMAGGSCSAANKAGNTPKPTTDAEFCRQVITDYWNAFNDFELEKALSYLEPVYAESRRAGIERELTQFEFGRAIGIKMVPYIFSEPLTLPDGKLDIRVTVKITPSGFSDDRYLMYYMVKLDGVWKIARQTDDPEKTPPSSPRNQVITIVSPAQVDLTWEDRSSRETGYRVQRALDSSFTEGVISVILPADSTSYSDKTVIPGTSYCYRVFAFNNAGESTGTPGTMVTLPLP